MVGCTSIMLLNNFDSFLAKNYLHSTSTFKKPPLFQCPLCENIDDCCDIVDPDIVHSYKPPSIRKIALFDVSKKVFNIPKQTFSVTRQVYFFVHYTSSVHRTKQYDIFLDQRFAFVRTGEVTIGNRPYF
ncbi:hypothetical protein RF11_03321 [Thelohanellus kitauei]|uniref:Uncharacterized protein n=1 Tax=Thelohanellus kitauei TaxID=669202 RepID=A0A0C2MR93_THEKT|nr:hypothetical protein RF11_03321 [Thelohanellus kitauei]